MTDATYFILGLIVGIGAMGLIILGWGLMNIASLISREEEKTELQEWLEEDGSELLKLDMGEALNRPTWPPPDDDVKSS
jgi:hypothetical protein